MRKPFTMYTHEEVNLHVEENYEAAHQAAANKDLPGIWKVAKPILTLVSNFPLLPKKWRNIVEGLIIAVDSIVFSWQS